MNRVAKVWDFIWGTLLVGMLPMFAFCLILQLGVLVKSETDGGWVRKFIFSFWLVSTFALSFFTLYYVGNWRQKHRMLPPSLFALEMVLGLFLAGAAFILMVVFWGFANLE
ncbi:MAG: hypothetical protein DVB31_06075 [Verrucomicrobia bacterium]|nr:MAG: hypothetical protein DVB31_06075 [Verrucomicrobiota bacterium]